MRVTIDMEKCYKSGECCYNHPRLFQLGDDGFPVILLAEPTTEADVREVHQAIEVCPAMAITLA